LEVLVYSKNIKRRIRTMFNVLAMAARAVVACSTILFSAIYVCGWEFSQYNKSWTARDIVM